MEPATLVALTTAALTEARRCLAEVKDFTADWAEEERRDTLAAYETTERRLSDLVAFMREQF